MADAMDSGVLAVVYAVHDFEAENPDELSFSAGERILVTEKDDQYQDGWWQGRNTKGELGLFPQSYTQPTPVAPTANATPVSSPKPAQNGFATAVPASVPDATVSERPTSRPPSPQREQLATGSAEPPAMRATIDDIQNHLDGMYKGQQTSNAASLPGTLPPSSIDNEQARSEPPAPATSIPEPQRKDSSAMGDDASSIVSGRSSVLDRDVEEDTDRQAQGNLMASHAKENLARNIALAQEKEEKKRIAAEREREAERERMRLNAQPVEGLVYSDESDAESAVGDDDNDNDSIFPSNESKRDGISESPEDYKYQPVSAVGASNGSALQQDESEEYRTPQLGSRNDRLSTGTATAIPPVRSLPNQETVFEPVGRTAQASGPDPYLVQHPPALQHQDSDAPSSYAPTPAQSPPVTAPVLSPLAASSFPAVASNDGSLKNNAEEPGTSVVQPLRSPGTAARDGFAVPAPATAQPPVVHQSAVPQPSQQDQSIPPASPHPSTTGSSRPGSTLGTAFTPATTFGGYDTSSPRSQTFGGRQQASSVGGDPREWGVEQVIEWGQSKGFDAVVLGKFREHEISGDVLLDMDVNSLKEIDIIAFGPRARIAKAIKELRVSAGVSSEPGSALSPSMSGYETASASAMSPSVNSTGYSPSPTTPMTFQSRDTPVLSSQYTGQDLRNSPVPEDQPVPSKAQTEESLTGLGVLPASPQVAQQQTIPATVEQSTDTVITVPTEPTEGAKSGRLQKSSSSSGTTRHARQSSGPASTDEKRPGGRGFSFGTLGRSRKPPPQYQGENDTTTVSGPGGSPSSGAVQRSPSTAAPAGNRLSTRLFAFGNNNSTSQVNSNHERGKRSISSPLEAQAQAQASSTGTTTPPVTSDNGTATSSPTPVVGRNPTTGAAVLTQSTSKKGQTSAEKIGEPDFAGWLRKRGERYNTWKERYLILKGVHLYVLKSPTEDKVKGHINLAGYKFVSDGSVDRGKYGFKALHESETTHYFSSGDSVITRNWMKALMKATIGRDYSAPVTSSSNIKTIPLSVAQSMNPPPRPPSPTSAVRVQKASLTTNPNSLSASDAAKLMGASIVPNASTGMERGFSASSAQGGKSPPISPTRRKPSSFLPPLKSSQRKKPLSDDLSASGAADASSTKRSPSTTFGNFDNRPPSFIASDGRRGSWYGKTVDSPVARDAANASSNTATPRVSTSSNLAPVGGLSEANRRPSAVSHMTNNPSQELLDWVNDHLPSGTAKAFEWTDLSSGRIYTRLAEHLGGKQSGIEESEFDKFRPLQPGRTPDMDYIDILFRCFDFLLDRGIKTEDVSINDLMTSNVPHLIKLADIIRIRYEG